MGVKQTTKAVTPNIALQSGLRPNLTLVGANKDYAEFRQMLESVNGLLRGSPLEAMALDFAKGAGGRCQFRATAKPDGVWAHGAAF